MHLNHLQNRGRHIMNFKQLNNKPFTYEEAKEANVFKDTSLDSKLFDWKGWDQLDTMSFIFYNCVLIEDIGSFKKGEKFSSISIDYEKSLIAVSKDDWNYNYSDDQKQWNTKEIYYSIE